MELNRSRSVAKLLFCGLLKTIATAIFQFPTHLLIPSIKKKKKNPDTLGLWYYKGDATFEDIWEGYACIMNLNPFISRKQMYGNRKADKKPLKKVQKNLEGGLRQAWKVDHIHHFK